MPSPTFQPSGLRLAAVARGLVVRELEAFETAAADSQAVDRPEASLAHPPVSSFPYQAMIFTPEQITLIEQIVDTKLAARRSEQPKRPAVALKNFHTIPEIRLLIVKHLNELIDELGREEFDIVLFRHCLAKKTIMREGDLMKENSRQNSAMTRWDRQVSNAIGVNWPDPPVTSINRRRYRFTQAALDAHPAK